MSDDLNTCAAQLARGDPDRLYAAMSAPVPVRRRLLPLYAFNLEMARAPFVTAEPMLAQIRLQWWRDWLEEVFSGCEVRRHAVATPLAAAVRDHGLPRDGLLALIDAREADIAGADPVTLEDYLNGTAVGLMRLSWRLCAGDPPDALADYAYGSGLANYLLAEPALRQMGRRSLLPEGQDRQALLSEALARFDAASATLRRENREGFPALRAGWRARSALRKPNTFSGEFTTRLRRSYYFSKCAILGGF